MADPKIKYDIEASVSGSPEILALANNVSKLADTLDHELKAKALASADSLRELGRQDATLTQFANLRNTVDRTAAEFTAAQKATAALGFEISALSKPTAAQAGQLQKLKDTAKSLELELGSESIALQRLGASLTASGVNTSQFVLEQVKVKNALSDAVGQATGYVNNLANIQHAMDAAAQSAAKESAEQDRLKKSMEAASAAAAAQAAEQDRLKSVMEAAAAAVAKQASELAKFKSSTAEIGALAHELDALEKSIDPAGIQRAKALRTEIEALGKQQAAVSTFVAFKNAVVDSKAAYEAAQVSAQKLGREIALAGTATSTQAAEFQKAREAVKTTSAAYLAHVAALQSARAAATAVKISTTDLSNAQVQLTASTKSAAASLSDLKARFGSVDEGAKNTAAGLGKVAGEGANLSGVFGKLGGVLATAFTGRELVSTIVSMDSLVSGFKAILGSGEAAAAEMAFLKKTSNELGLEVQSAGKAYLSLTAATKGTAIEGEKTREIFISVSRAMSVLGKSADETENALRAISQMASKGTVSMEELRGQLGEALPGAMKAAADGAGITVDQLNKMVERGDVLAKDLLPALNKGLNDIYAKGSPPDTLISNWNRLKNRITEVSTELGESGLTKAMTDVAIAGTNTIGVLGKGFVGLGKGIGEVSAAVATLNFKPLLEDYRLLDKDGSIAFEHISQKIHEVGLAINPSVIAADLLAKKFNEGADAAERLAQKAKETFRKSEIAAQQMGNTVQEAFRKSEIAASNTESILKLKQHYSELELAATRRIEVATKANAAAKSEADTINLIASAFGNEIDKMQAAQLASDVLLDAQNALTNAKKVDLIVAQQKLDSLINETKGMKELTPELKTQKEALEQAVAVKNEDVRANVAHTESLKTSALAAQTAAEAYKDNAAKVYEYRGAVMQATAEVDRLIALEQRGLATKKEVADAQRVLAKATQLYRDAMGDATAAAERNERTVVQKSQTQQKESDLNVEAAKTTLELAKARGDDTAIAKAQLLVTNEEVGAKRAIAQALRDEAEAMRKKADAREAEAKAAGTLTEAKKEEIAAIRESAKQKDIDAQKSDLLANREQALAAAVAQSADTYVNALEKKISAQEKLNALKEREDALEDKRLGRDKDKFSVDSSGKRIEMLVETQRSVFDRAKGQGLNDQQALSIADQFMRNGKQSGGSGAQTQRGENWGTELQKAIDAIVLQNARSSGNKPADTTAAGPASTPSQSGRSPTHTVNIKIPGGGSFPVQTDAAGAQNMIAALQQSARNAGF